jgi:signal transduction histidine kinase
MKMPGFSSLRRRLLLISTVQALATLLIAASLFVAYDVHTTRSQMIRDLEVLAAVVGDNCASALVFDVPETAEANLASLNREYQIRHATLFDHMGNDFARYARDSVDTPRDPGRSPDDAFDGHVGTWLGSVEVARDISLEGQLIGRIVIHAEMDELAAHLNRYSWLVALLCGLVLVVSLTLALRLQRRVSKPILDLADSARDIAARADYSQRASPASCDEIADLVRSFNAMLDQVERRERQLQQVRGDLEEANGQLRRMAMQLSLVGEQEKKRLAGELHDSPMQKLALAQAQITSALRRRDRESYTLLESGQDLVRDALQELRTLQFELSPPVLHQEGLAAALHWLASSASERFGITISFIPGTRPDPVDRELGLVLFQCARELIHNVIRHADASLARIILDVLDGQLLLVVEDNGKGLPEDGATANSGEAGGYGLYSVSERVSLLGGEFAVTSDSMGTCARIQVPLVSPFESLKM